MLKAPTVEIDVKNSKILVDGHPLDWPIENLLPEIRAYRYCSRGEERVAVHLLGESTKADAFDLSLEEIKEGSDLLAQLVSNPE